MKKTLALSLFAALACAASSEATILINLTAADLQTNVDLSLIPEGTLLQLVNLGNDGVFNNIDLTDGDSSQLGQWVSGDDTLVNVAFRIPNGGGGTDPGDFSTAAAFDLTPPTGSPQAGVMIRGFEFAFGAVPTGAKLGLRWFPGLLASNFSATTLNSGQIYGQFTRQGTLLNGGDTAWVFPGDGATIGFDPLITASEGGNDPNSAGKASFSVVPEPSSMSIALLGGLALVGRRRRRSA